VRVADGAKIDTRAAYGKTGTWLIDPTDFIVAASGGDISGAMLGRNLSATNVTIQSSSGAIAGNGDIFVNDTVSWSANTLTLDAYRNIMVNREMNGWQHRRRQHPRPRQPSRRQSLQHKTRQ
jgi:hypothetical protein